MLCHYKCNYKIWRNVSQHIVIIKRVETAGKRKFNLIWKFIFKLEMLYNFNLKVIETGKHNYRILLKNYNLDLFFE